MPPATPRISSAWIERPSSASGELKRHQMCGLGIGDDDPPVGPEHDQAVRHGVERAVEALRDAASPSSPPTDRREQHVAHEVGEAMDGEEERDRQQAEHDVIEVAAQDEAERRSARSW